MKREYAERHKTSRTCRECASVWPCRVSKWISSRNIGMTFLGRGVAGPQTFQKPPSWAWPEFKVAHPQLDCTLGFGLSW